MCRQHPPAESSLMTALGDAGADGSTDRGSTPRTSTAYLSFWHPYVSEIDARSRCLRTTDPLTSDPAGVRWSPVVTSLSPLRAGLIAVGVIALVAVVVLLNRPDLRAGAQALVGEVPAVEVEHDGVRFLLTDRDGGEFCTYGWDLYARSPRRLRSSWRRRSRLCPFQELKGSMSGHTSSTLRA